MNWLMDGVINWTISHKEYFLKWSVLPLWLYYFHGHGSLVLEDWWWADMKTNFKEILAALPVDSPTQTETLSVCEGVFACLTLKEAIYNSQRLLCIPREDCLVWAAPDFNLASQLQFPNLSLRLSVPVQPQRGRLHVACQRASRTSLPFRRVNSGCVCLHKSHSKRTSFSLSHGWVSVHLCVQTSMCCYSVAEAAHWNTAGALVDVKVCMRARASALISISLCACVYIPLNGYQSNR